jgi:hypothetical protein
MFLFFKSDGNATITDDDGNTYSGQFKAHRRSGLGTMQYSNQNKYEGGWLNDLKEGDGK